jgi:hypothetical protein
MSVQGMGPVISTAMLAVMGACEVFAKAGTSPPGSVSRRIDAEREAVSRSKLPHSALTRP